MRFGSKRPRVRIPTLRPYKNPNLSTGQIRVFIMISVPVGTGDRADAMIAATQIDMRIAYVKADIILRKIFFGDVA